MQTLSPTLSLLALTGLIVLSGCSTTSHVSSEQAKKIQMCKDELPVSKKIKTESVTTGCLMSYMVNRAINSKDPSPLLCFAGGASGLMFGESVAERQCGYLTLEQQLDGEIAHAMQMNAGIATVFAQQAKELGQFETAAAGLARQKASAEAQQQALSGLTDSLDQQLNKDKAFLAVMRDEYRYKRETLSTSRTLQQQDKEAQLLKEIEALQDSIKTLEANQLKLNRVRAGLAG